MEWRIFRKFAANYIQTPMLTRSDAKIVTL